MAIRPYAPGDDDALYDVCLRTGDSGEDATGKYADPRLMGEIFVGPYLRFEPELASVIDDDEGVAGYVLGARDTPSFEDACERDWWPPLRERYPLDAFPAGSPDTARVAQIHAGHRSSAEIVAEYPAHLHIDLLPRAQGRGLGRALIEHLLATLHEAGVPAVHLGVGANNQRAIGFYERLGFATLRESASDRQMGRSTGA